MKKISFTQEDMMKVLDTCYENAVQGLPGSPNCYEIADQYIAKYQNRPQAAKEFIKWQIAKCTTSGFVTNLGGIMTLPVAIPANLASVWYIQMRMLATLAVIGNFNPLDDDVQTLVYVCLTGSSLAKVCQEAGIQFGEKFTIAMIKKIPGATLTKINRAVGFRFVTKFGEKGVINIAKMVPVVGGVIGGGFDFVGTKVIADSGYKTFLKNELD